jgi:hypothetical protein
MKKLDTALPNPVPNAASSALELSLEGVLDRMGHTIVEAPRSATSRPVRRRRSIALAFAAVVFALAFAGLLAVDRHGAGSSAWAAEDIAMAVESPQMLLPTSWRVTRLDQYSDGNLSGEMSFRHKRDKHEAGLFWVEPKYHQQYVRDRAVYAHATTAPTSDGHVAKVFYDWTGAIGGPDSTSYVALWLNDGHSMRFETAYRGSPDKVQVKRFKNLLAQVHTVSPEVWLSALPASYLLPSEIPTAAKQILADVEVPAGFAAARPLQNIESATRDQLAYTLISAVQCAWIGDWLTARRQKNREEMKSIEKSLAGYRSWKYIPASPEPDGGRMSYMGEQYIESLAHRGAMDIGVPGKTRDVSKDYEAGLGCEAP